MLDSNQSPRGDARLCALSRRRLLASTALPLALAFAVAAAPDPAQAQEVIDGPPLVTKSADQTITGDLVVGENLPGSELVIDSGAVITVTGRTIVGENSGANGLVTIEDGQLGNGLGYIGYSAGSTGAVTVTGPDARWVSSSAMYVGNGGAGTLLIEAGGTVDDTAGIIGSDATGVGVATVTGVGSTWNNSAEFYVGLFGSGALTIEDGGAVNVATSAYIGRFANSVGVATVTGPGSTLTATAELHVGYSSNGTLTVSDGGAVSNATGYIGFANATTGAGAVTVTGIGSTWINSAALYVGEGNDGTLTVSEGGLVQVAGGAGTITVGFDAGSSGLINIGAAAGDAAVGAGVLDAATIQFGDGTGSGVVFNHTDLAYTFDLAVTGVGTVSHHGGETVLTSLLNDWAGDTDIHGGTLVVEGVNSHAGQAVYVGRSALDDGALVVRGGGLLSNADTFIGFSAGSSGEATVTGAGSIWSNAGDLTVGDSGTGTLTIADEGLVQVAGGAGTITLASQPGSTGVLNIGAVVGDPAAAAGVLDAATVRFGATNFVVGTGSVNFNHTDAAYTFDPAITGIGTVNHYAGETVLTSLLNNWTNATNVHGGTLIIEGNYTNPGNPGSDAIVGRDLGDDGALIVRDGGYFGPQYGYVGFDAGSTGAVVVTGPGSIWSVNFELMVGRAGDGSMTIEDGGAVSNFTGYIGFAADAVGAVTVTGAGSLWTNTNTITVGESGAGTLTVEAGGDVTNGGATIGNQDGAVGVASVTGSGSTWISSSRLTVGRFGDGTLAIEDGGLVRSDGGSIGSESGSTSSVMVTGLTSTWNNLGDLTIGGEGEGVLTIAAGGAVDSVGGVIGAYFGSLGNTAVNGPGSIWASSGSLTVGGEGEGYLLIDDSGAVVSDGGAIGDFVDGLGDVFISGAGSRWESASGVIIGNEGFGSLTLDADGVLSIDGGAGTLSIALGVDSSGVLNIGDPCLCAPGAAGVLDAAQVVFGDGQGAIVFRHNETDYEFAAVIEGFGAISVEAGHTILTGDSSGFTGVTSVIGLDPGDLPNLTVDGVLGGDVFVLGGGELSGVGSILGHVDVDDGVLSNVAGDTLSMASLSLTTDSVVAVSLGSPGSPGLFNVTGDLLLDGGLTVVDAGGFGPGVYRLFDYGGALTDNGLEIDSVPSGVNPGDLSVQTSVANQVNLVRDIDPGDLLFWDGADDSLHDNDSVNGGDGVWDAVNGNWTNLGGTVNGAMSPQPGFAIFQGEPGAVIVDDSLGAIGVTGMQFAVDGYAVEGDAIALTESETVIRVGDGSAGGADFTVTIASVLNGAGGLVKTDLGTLVLTGPNTYTGGTSVQAGVLVGDTNSLRGDIANDGRVEFRQSFDGTYADVWSGSGVFEKTGAGTLTLTGLSGEFAGETFIENGILVVNGALGGALTIGENGRLEGTGELGVVLIADNAVIAPGNSIGVLTINGDIVFAVGAAYEVETDPVSGVSDLIHATGTATINGGAVAHIGLAGDYKPFSIYTILTADGGVTGTFDDLTTDFAFLDPELTYDPTNVYLTLVRNDITFAGIGETPNQIATGDAVESLGLGAPLWDAVVGQSVAGARGAFNQLSGEIHASTRGALLDDGHRLRQAMTGRLRRDLAEGINLWAEGYGASAETDGDGNAASFDLDGTGLFVGADAQLGAWRLGVSVGSSDNEFDASGGAASSESQSHHLALYGGGQWEEWGLRFGVARSWHKVTTDRNIAFTGFSDSTQASYDASSTQAFVEAGWRFDAGPVVLEPFANLAHATLDADPFIEDGGAAALTSGGEEDAVTFTTVGARAARAFVQSEGRQMTLHGSVGWRHAVGDITPESRFTFGGVGDSFTIRGVPIAEDALVIETGLDVDLSADLVVGFAYAGQVGDSVRDHTLRGRVSWRF